LRGVHLVRFEIVEDVIARPDLIILLDLHVAIGDDFAGILIEHSPVSGHHGSVPNNFNPIRKRGGVILQIHIRRALNNQLIFIRRLRQHGKGRDEKNHRGEKNGGQSCHSAAEPKQMRRSLPSDKRLIPSPAKVQILP